MGQSEKQWSKQNDASRETKEGMPRSVHCGILMPFAYDVVLGGCTKSERRFYLICASHTPPKGSTMLI